MEIKPPLKPARIRIMLPVAWRMESQKKLLLRFGAKWRNLDSMPLIGPTVLAMLSCPVSQRICAATGLRNSLRQCVTLLSQTLTSSTLTSPRRLISASSSYLLMSISLELYLPPKRMVFAMDSAVSAELRGRPKRL